MFERLADAPDPSDDDDDVKQEGVRKFLEENWEMIARMDAIVVGPGLGRDWYTWLLVCAAVNVASIRCVRWCLTRTRCI